MTTDRFATRVLPLAILGAIGVALLPGAAPATPPRAVPTATAWALPTRDGMQVDLATAPDGSMLMAWVDGQGAAQRLRFSRSRGGRWSAPVTVATSDGFGNAVDTPRLRQTRDGAVWLLWLRKGAGGGHARDVVLTRSPDGGATWSAAVPVNTDGTPTEHGFASTWDAGRDRIGVAWLDGRAKSGGHGHGDGAQMLRAATFDARLQRAGEAVLDARVCDCCHTDIAATSRGPVLVYRDRSETEVRDIRATRLENGRWSTPSAVADDGWRMPACPVNGPGAAASGVRMAAAWYTAADGSSEVRLATSRDAGKSFSAATTLDRGDAVLGRVEIAVQGDRAAVAWLREDASAQSLWLATASIDTGRAGAPVRIATLAGRGRGTGMPRMAIDADGLHVVWTELVDGRPVLQGRTLALR
ncbi:hypothetical protein [Lysobacter xanthus]